MTTEVQDLAEVVTAPEQAATVAPATDATTPEVTSTQAARTFSQEELDAAIGKRLAREQRKWEREHVARTAETQVQATPQSSLSIEQFESPEAYAEALAYHKADELATRREAMRGKAAVVEVFNDLEEHAREKFDDYDQVTRNPSLRITEVMMEAIQTSDIGPQVAYHLGTNPKEATRIALLAPYAQAKEMGKLEAKLASNPPVKQTTKAPTPISPVTARSSGSPAYDTTDPRSIQSMTTSEWIEADRARQIKKLQARENR